MTATDRRILLHERPEGRPAPEDFELVERDVPEPGPGDVLVRTRYLSVDPYMRGRMRDAESYAEPWDVGDTLRGGVVGEVAESRSDAFAEGDVVTGNLYWADYAVAEPGELTEVDPELAPVSTALGVLGMPGRTAYLGTLDVMEPDPGDTVVVSGAAGAVGSVAGQISSLAGARVVGVAGSERKTDWLTDELGFDAAINYKAEDVADALGRTCPEGVDCYFDNVGGPITDAVFERLNVDARVAVCGQISLYNEEAVPTGPRKLGRLVTKRARVEGFLHGDFAPRHGAATEQLAEWVNDGDVRYRETVTDGLENAPGAFIGLFEGENVGKQLVKVADGSA
jgi:NADPH-dependent curcumin reductase CurA